MPRVILSRYECSRDRLPRVCMFCGETAADRKEMAYAWHPVWVWGLIAIFPPVGMIVAVAMTRRMTVRVPVCSRHAGFWIRRTLIILGSFAVVAGLWAGGMLLMSIQPPGPRGGFAVWMSGAAALLFFAWLI